MSAGRRHPKIDDIARLRHMLDAARRACELSKNKSVGQLDPDSETALALARLLEILGEAARGVSPELQSRYPEVPWRDIADTRNRIIHEYFDVDYEIVESIIHRDLPSLIEHLEMILETVGSG